MIIRFIIQLYWRLLHLFGINTDTEPIPDSVYCYVPDTEKNKRENDVMHYYIKPCKYYKSFGNEYNGCKYLGIITDDFLFDDQCKICGIKDQVCEPIKNKL